jgi:hypothetical protein
LSDATIRTFVGAAGIQNSHALMTSAAGRIDIV